MTDRRVRGLVLGPQPSISGFAYDYDELGAFGVALHQTGRTGYRPLAKARDVIEHRSGIPWEVAARGIGQRADFVLALLEGNVRAALRFRRFHVRPYSKAQIIVLCCWLAEDLRNADRVERERIRIEYSRADLLLCLSRNQIPIFEEAGFERRKVAAIPYGVAPSQFDGTPELTRDIPLLSVGIDRGRDYGTLVSAMRRIETPLELYTQPRRVQALNPPMSIRSRDPVPYLEYRSLLRRSKVVVVPTYELAYPTGQSVALQAAMEGACVVVTSTEAMREYFQPGVTAMMPAVGDAGALADAIRHLLHDDAARTAMARSGHEHVRRNFSSTKMWGSAWTEIRARLGACG